jgi:hypothetical protein
MSRRTLACALLLLAWGCSSGEKKSVEKTTRPAPDSVKASTEAVEKGEESAAPGVSEDTLTEGDGLKNFSRFSLDDAIIVDLNGDQVNDTATFETRNFKGGIVITDGRTSGQTLIGCGHAFEEMGDDFSWVDEWGIVRDSSTYEVLIGEGEIIGEQEFVLANPSIYVRKAEVGGGIISFKDGKFQWVHQAD